MKILGTDQFYWDGGSIVMVAPNDATKLINIGQYRTGDYGIAVSTDNGTTWTTIIDFDGLHGGDGGGSGEQTIIYQDAIVKSPTAPTNPSLNDLWIDTILLRLRMWSGEEWVNIGYEPETPEPGPDEPIDPDPGDEPGGEEPGGDDPGGEEGGGTGGDDPGGNEEENPGDETPEEGGS